MTDLAPSPFRPVIEAMFCIVNEDGVKVDFKLNPSQARLDAAWTRRNIVPKARQPGISSYVLARFVAKCLTMDNRTCVIVSHEADATRRLLQRANYYIENIKGGVKPQLGRHSQNEITFSKTNSKIYIGTAGQRAFGHGDTITDLHLSEASRYPDCEKIVGGLFPAAERGEITVESTGNGVGNWYHRQCLRAFQGQGFTLHFFPWHEIPKYALPFASPEAEAAFAATLSEELEETELHARGISLAQLAWRRERLTIDFEGDLVAFKEAYPATFDECFQSKEHAFFRNVRYVDVRELWERVGANLHILRGHPVADYTYVIGVDPAGGVGGDSGVASVWCLQTAEEVASLSSNLLEPHVLGREVAALGRRFNYAYINVERNNHGLVTLTELLNMYPAYLIHRNTHSEDTTQAVLRPVANFGTLVGPANRGLLIGTARTLLAETFTVHSPELKLELSTFVEKKDGKIEADDGCHDDHVMAAVHALTVVERAGVVATAGERSSQLSRVLDAERTAPFSFDAIFVKTTAPPLVYGSPAKYH